MRNKVKAIFENTLQKMQSNGVLDVAEIPNFAVSVPKDESNGDFAINAAMALAKPAKCKPRDLAEKIIANLEDPEGFLSSTEIAGPGFINVRLASSVWQAVIGDIEIEGAKYGWAAKPSGKRINVEYVSANPTGPLHVGHGRGAIVGDALVRLLKAAGYDVTTEYYVNDHGNQVDILARSLHLRYQELLGRQVELPANAYPAEYVIDIARALVDKYGDRFVDAPESKWLDAFRSFGIARNLESIRRDLQLIDVSFDVWSHESELHKHGHVADLIDAMRLRGELYEATESTAGVDKVRREGSKAAQHSVSQQGGTFACLARHGDDDDRIVLRSDGTPVYLTSDLAYHREKLRRGFDTCVDVFGADHFSHTRTLHAGLKALGEDAQRLEFVLTQIVRLLRGGQEVRISKRAGTIELLSDLIEAVGADATRFFFLMRAPSAQFDFDLDVATAHSMDNPVFYVQYGHARACALFRRAHDEGIAYGGYAASTMANLQLPEELGLLRKMAAFSGLIADAAEAREPHRLVYFIESLIRDFHAYYTRYKKTERIVSDDVDKTQARLGLVNAMRQVLFNALQILGVSAPERMESASQDEEGAA